MQPELWWLAWAIPVGVLLWAFMSGVCWKALCATWGKPGYNVDKDLGYTLSMVVFPIGYAIMGVYWAGRAGMAAPAWLSSLRRRCRFPKAQVRR